MFGIFKKKDPGQKPAPPKLGEKAEQKKKSPRMPEKGNLFSRIKRPQLQSEWRVRPPWWVRGLNWRELPWWGRVFIILGAVGIGFGIWTAVLSSAEPPPMYYLGVAVSPENSGVISYNNSDNKYLDGTQVVLMAEPLPGYGFDSWSGDASGSSPTATVIMDANKAVTANFNVIRHDLGISVNPLGGGSVSPGDGSYDTGEMVTLTAEPSPGYEFIGWSGDASGSSPIVILAMDSDKSVTALFSLIRYDLTTAVNIPEGGGISPAGGSYDIGEMVTLTAEPSPDYAFIGWSGDVSGSNPTVTVTMDSDKIAFANFEATFQEINYTMLPGISASVVTYFQPLERGDVIEGFVELTGEFSAQDWSFDWTFEILNPEGRVADIFRGHWVEENHYDFSHETKYSGTYKLRIHHNSLSEKYLLIRIWPQGW